MRSHLRIVLALGSGLALSACADLGASIRPYTYPPNFTYISDEKLESTMWQLAEEVRWLDAVLRDETRTEPDRQQTVLRLLDQIDETTRELGTDRGVTNHPLLDAHLPRLRDDVALARSAVASNPPHYVLAGAVTGACVY